MASEKEIPIRQVRQTLNRERQARIDLARAEYEELNKKANPPASRTQPPRGPRTEVSPVFTENDFRYGVAIYDSFPSYPYLLFYEYANNQYYLAGKIYGTGSYGYPSGFFHPSLYSYGYVWNTLYAGHGNRVFAPVNEISGNTNWESSIFSIQIGTQFIDNYSFYAIYETAGKSGYSPYFSEAGYYGYGGRIFNTAYAATYVTPTGVYGPFGGLISLMSIDYYNSLYSGLYVTTAGVGI